MTNPSTTADGTKPVRLQPFTTNNGLKAAARLRGQIVVINPRSVLVRCAAGVLRDVHGPIPLAYPVTAEPEILDLVELERKAGAA